MLRFPNLAVATRRPSIDDGHARIKRFRAGIHHRKWFGDARVFAKGTNPKQLVTTARAPTCVAW